MTGFAVEPDELERRAARIDEIAARLDDAATAAAAGAPGAFGILCAFFPAMLAPAQQGARDALGQGAGSVRSMGDAVRASARTYARGDDAVASSLRPRAP